MIELDTLTRINNAKKIFEKEIEALNKTKECLNETFSAICHKIINCTGKVIWIGMGKPGHIAGKLAATMASLGTPSFAIHPAEALHGDLGMISKEDLLIIISYSGESDEIIRLIPSIKLIGCELIALTGNEKSTLAKNADIIQVFPKFEEACHIGLAPTSSTTVALAYGDALAVVTSSEKKFTKNDFSKLHPAGALGKRLTLKVKDLMIPKGKSAVISPEASCLESIVCMSKLNLPIVTALDNNIIKGILTDGDLRRLLENKADIYSLKFNSVMTKKPIVIRENQMAVEAYKLMNEKRINSMPVINDIGEYVGVIIARSILDSGIVINNN